jgi:hypothetical protein
LLPSDERLEMLRVNGTEARIEIFKPFGEAFELMKKILFQPFDLKKWFVIGFAAWLANLGGGGFKYQYNRREDMQKLNDAISQVPHPILVAGVCVLISVVLVLIVLFAWLRARGRFMFIDCIVKNRGAVATPWHDFRKEGNSYFLFSLAVGLALFVFAVLLSVPLLLLVVKGRYYFFIHHDQLNIYLISAIAAWAFAVILFVLAWSLVANFLVPVMYVQRCHAAKAFGIVARLIAEQPGEVLLYCLFLIVLALATAIVACLVTCATCCIAAIPYIGTVILLPIFVLLRSFSLLFLRQFGPEYDVWASFVPPEFLPILSSAPTVPPPPPSGSSLNEQ